MLYSGIKVIEFGYWKNKNEWVQTRFKQPMKGGHTHNHIYNVANRKVFRSKSRRKVPNSLKKQFVQTFYENLNLNYNGSFFEFIKGLQ